MSPWEEVGEPGLWEGPQWQRLREHLCARHGEERRPDKSAWSRERWARSGHHQGPQCCCRASGLPGHLFLPTSRAHHRGASGGPMCSGLPDCVVYLQAHSRTGMGDKVAESLLSLNSQNPGALSLSLYPTKASSSPKQLRLPVNQQAQVPRPCPPVGIPPAKIGGVS